MKKYKAKFLPVDGEVKEGDNYLSKWRQEHKFFHYSTCKKIENGKVFPTEGVGSKDGFDVSDIITKVKLFLCTIDDNKPIGEISPEAIFVTDGDTFEESEFHVCIKDNRDKLTSATQYLIKIKCNKCETFH